MRDPSTTEVLLYLLKIALGKDGNRYSLDHPLPNSCKVDWPCVMHLAAEQGVIAIAADGLQRIFDSSLEFRDECLEQLTPSLSEDLYYSWLGQVMLCEVDYQNHLTAIEKLARVYERAGLRMMLLKGYGLSLNWPVPEHRPVGDIDIWLINENDNDNENRKDTSSDELNDKPVSNEDGLPTWKSGDEAVERILGIKVDNSHHHHSVFQYGGFSVENHYDFVNIHSHRSNKKIDLLFKRLAEDRSHAIPHILPNGAKIYFPPSNLHALFLAWHGATHFAAERMTLRQLLDWALLIKTHHEEVDWSLFWNEAEKMGMTKFVLCVNAIAVHQLGFNPEIFHTPEHYAGFAAKEQVLVDRVLGDIMHPEFNEPNGKGAIKYVYGRFRRWWHNRWKHRLVYSDSLLDTFFVQIRSHLMKPSTLIGR